MKKQIIISILALFVVFASCKKDETITQPQNTNVASLIVGNYHGYYTNSNGTVFQQEVEISRITDNKIHIKQINQLYQFYAYVKVGMSKIYIDIPEQVIITNPLITLKGAIYSGDQLNWYDVQENNLIYSLEIYNSGYISYEKYEGSK